MKFELELNKNSPSFITEWVIDNTPVGIYSLGGKSEKTILAFTVNGVVKGIINPNTSSTILDPSVSITFARKLYDVATINRMGNKVYTIYPAENFVGAQVINITGNLVGSYVSGMLAGYKNCNELSEEYPVTEKDIKSYVSKTPIEFRQIWDSPEDYSYRVMDDSEIINFKGKLYNKETCCHYFTEDYLTHDTVLISEAIGFLVEGSYQLTIDPSAEFIYADGECFLNTKANILYYNIRFCKGCGEYVRDKCDCDEVKIFGYCSGKGRKDMRNGCDIGIGLEVEKEDEDVKNSMGAKKLLKKTGWALERDGSLNDYTGFELVSPILGLRPEESAYDNVELNAQLKSVEDYLNAEYSPSCGG